MTEEQKKIEQILTWAIKKDFSLSTDEWLKLGDRADALAKEIPTPRFRKRLAIILSFISDMAKAI